MRYNVENMHYEVKICHGWSRAGIGLSHLKSADWKYADSPPSISFQGPNRSKLDRSSFLIPLLDDDDAAAEECGCCEDSGSEPDPGLGLVDDEDTRSGVAAFDALSSSSSGAHPEKSKNSINSSPDPKPASCPSSESVRPEPTRVSVASSPP